MSVTLQHPDALVRIEQLGTGKHKISVELLNQGVFMPRSTWETSYPLALVEQIINVKGPAYPCDEIMRDEHPTYVEHNFRYDILSYVGEDGFDNKRILDFACGCGASTVVLARMFPSTEIVGVELINEFASIAKLRAKHYGFDKVSFLLSPDGDSLPDGLGDFDFVVLGAVYEHLLPSERNTLLPKIWSHLRPGGILFISQTPQRHFPLEAHTTGLPLINYCPDRVALWLARRFSRRVNADESWEALLRAGIRGGTVKETMGILNRIRQEPILLEPERLGIKDRIDLWRKSSSTTRLPTIKKLAMYCIGTFKSITGITLVPSLSLAIKKPFRSPSVPTRR